MPPRDTPFLPEGYMVGPTHVIIGRGKRCLDNPGNIRFKAIIQGAASVYSGALTKLQKSAIITEVLGQVRGADGIGFVKRDSATGLYTKVDESASRIAIAQSFRDALSGTYKSSKKHKQVRRIEKMKSVESSESTDALTRAIFDDFFEHVPPRRLVEETASHQPASSEISMMNLRDVLLQEATAVPDITQGQNLGSNPTSLKPDEPANHSESSMMMNLQDVLLQEATAVPDITQGQNLGSNPTSLKPDILFSTGPRSEADQSCFSTLYSVFGSKIDAINNEDPFEPTPLESCDTFQALEFS